MRVLGIHKFFTIVCLTLLGMQVHATFYAVKTANIGSNSASNGSVLVTIDDSATPFTVASANKITLSGQDVFLDGLALTLSGQLYGFVNSDLSLNNPLSTATSQLVRIDPATAAATAIGAPIASASINGAAFDRTGRLYAINVVDQTLVEVDPATGAVITTLSLSSPSSPSDMRDSDLAFDIDNNAYIARRGVGVFPLDVNTATIGAAVPGLVDDINGLAFVGENEGVYLEESGEDQVAVFGMIASPVIPPLADRLNLSVPPVSTLVANAGAMDLAGMPMNRSMATSKVPAVSGLSLGMLIIFLGTMVLIKRQRTNYSPL